MYFGPKLHNSAAFFYILLLGRQVNIMYKFSKYCVCIKPLFQAIIFRY